ncbi:CoA transferase [Rhodococcus sp. SMB37]|uniref:CaiB/BaiF CoA transferase family protein n=1 Tax=Rhodococcus sp. SMB37 TaxID=2512213 RepID=UPI00104BEC77|nr:CoA transferase [Rhodococcus sp. SMB37]
MKPLLHGVRVLDLSRALAGPLCTSLLADFGADIIKVESIGRGDSSRQWPPFDGSDSLYFASVNRSKRSVALDMRTDEGRKLLRRMASEVDVIVENFRPGVLAAMGLDQDSLRRDNPGVIVMSVSGFGPTGPDRFAPGLDQVAQGMSGLMSVTGGGDDTPMRVGVPIIDTVSGIYAALGITAALVARSRDGEGHHVQTSLIESALSIMTFQAQDYLSTGRVSEPNGNTHPTITPYGCFDTADCPIIIATGSDKHWEALCVVLGDPDLAKRPDYATGVSRLEHRDTLTKELLELLSHRSAAEWVTAMRSAGIPCGPVHSIDQAFADPQVQALDMVQKLTTPDGKDLPLLRGPFWVDSETLPIRNAPPMVLGQDTDAVLAEFGVGEAELDGLHRAGVI